MPHISRTRKHKKGLSFPISGNLQYYILQYSTSPLEKRYNLCSDRNIISLPGFVMMTTCNSLSINSLISLDSYDGDCILMSAIMNRKPFVHRMFLSCSLKVLAFRGYNVTQFPFAM